MCFTRQQQAIQCSTVCNYFHSLFLLGLHAGDVVPEHAAVMDDEAEHQDHGAPDLEVCGEDCDQKSDDDEEQLHPDMMPYMFVDTGSESEGEPVPSSLTGATRVRSLESQPEYQRLKEMGLTVRPNGCCLGCHPSARTYRAWYAGSTHFSRSFGDKVGRTPWQALLRVMQLMLEAYLESNATDKLAKKQLARIVGLRDMEPPHPN